MKRTMLAILGCFSAFAALAQTNGGVRLTGVSSALGFRQALLEVAEPGFEARCLIFSEGERGLHRKIEVTGIDVEHGAVELLENGQKRQLKLEGVETAARSSAATNRFQGAMHLRRDRKR